MGALLSMMQTSSLGLPASATIGNSGKKDAQLNVSNSSFVVKSNIIFLNNRVARVSQTNSEQSKTNQVASSRRTSTVETKKISRLETTKATSNGETHHKVDTNETNETETQNKVVDNGPKDNASPEASKSDSGHETSDTQTDDAVVNPTQDMATELPNKDHSQVPLKNQI